MDPKELPKHTFYENDKWWTEYKEPCNCNKGFIQKYYCNILTCEDNKEQPLYCMQCVLDEGKHFEAHKKQIRVSIKDEVYRLQEIWKAIV